MNMLEVTIADGKYTVIQDETGRLKALRYGEEWRDCCGDGLIYALAAEIDSLKLKLDEAQAKCAEMRDVLNLTTLFACAYTSHPKRNPADKLNETLEKAKHSLSDDCGKGWVRVDKTFEVTLSRLREIVSVSHMAGYVKRLAEEELTRLEKLFK